MVRITGVVPRGRAGRRGVQAGDTLVSVNGRAISDALDYRFALADTEVRLSLLRDGRPFEVVVRKRRYDDVGLLFETPLMDRKRSCENRCVFCFVDQMPKGLRDTLYFKDDDFRLSFLHGNFITLTNLSDEDVGRIIEMRLSPMNVSVHTTDPDLRVRMMRNRRAGETLAYLPRLAAAGISLNAQIVLCRGINDGPALDRTMRDLSGLGDALAGVSVVPVGLTRFRDGLPPLSPYSAAEAAAIVRRVEAEAEDSLKRCGSRRFFCSDEFYLQAGLPLPDADAYEDFPQMENGVGMIAFLLSGFRRGMRTLDRLLADFQPPRRVSVATGAAALGTIRSMAAALEAAVPGLEIRAYGIANRAFGETVTVAGLLTGRDLSEQLAGRDLGDELLIPGNALRAEGDRFLDDLTPGELSERLGGVPVRPVGNSGDDFIRAALGL